MNDQQQSNGIPVTRFILQSVYAQSDDEKLEFDYESGSTNIVVRLFHCWNVLSLFNGTLFDVSHKCRSMTTRLNKKLLIR
jgi:hypothetical protein